MSRRKTAPLAASFAPAVSVHGRSLGQLVFMVKFLVVVTGAMAWLELFAKFAVATEAGR